MTLYQYFVLHSILMNERFLLISILISSCYFLVSLVLFWNWNNIYKCKCWYFIVILTCISLTNNVEHLFIYSFAIHISSLMKWLYSSFTPYFFLMLFSFLLFSWVLYLTWRYLTWSDMWSVNISFWPVALAFHSLHDVFHREKVFNLDRVQLVNFFFAEYAFSVVSKNSVM